MIKVLQRALLFRYRQYYQNFEPAVEQMKKKGEFINKYLMENQKLQIWAIYMQATQGDAKQGQLKQNNDQPNTNESREELNKYEAWKMYEGKSQEQAKEDYVKIVKELMERHGHKVDF